MLSMAALSGAALSSAAAFSAKSTCFFPDSVCSGKAGLSVGPCTNARPMIALASRSRNSCITNSRTGLSSAPSAWRSASTSSSTPWNSCSSAFVSAQELKLSATIPLSDRLDGSARWTKSNAVMLAWPHAAASNNGVSPTASPSFGSAPARKMRITCEVSPPCAARDNCDTLGAEAS